MLSYVGIYVNINFTNIYYFKIHNHLYYDFFCAYRNDNINNSNPMLPIKIKKYPTIFFNFI